MYRGKDRGPGFVIQSHHLDTALSQIFAALDHHAPENAPHAFRSDGPLCFVLRLPGEQYQYLSEMFETLAPTLVEMTEIFFRIVVPSGLPAAKCEAAVNMLMVFPVLRSATVSYLSCQMPGQYYGLDILISPDDAVVNEVGELNEPYLDHAAISSFLARDEPLPR